MEVLEPRILLRSQLTALQPMESLLNEYELCGLEKYDYGINTDWKEVIWHRSSKQLRDITALDSLIIEFGL